MSIQMDVSYNLRPLWDAILDLHGRFDAYCKKHQLRYYVTGGTLLGAVRHDGFIPWDDDFDVVMPRPDYVRFLQLIRDDAIPHAMILAKEFDLTYPYLFAKVVETRPSVVASVKQRSSLDLPDGINIDVIPIDGMPKATLPFYYWALKRATWRHRNTGGAMWRILWCILWGFEKDPRNPLSFERWLASYDYDASPAADDYNSNGRRFKLRCLSAKSFGKPVLHRFCHVEVPLPREWDLFLKVIYGDYMKLPPEAERKPRHQSLEEIA